MIKNNYFKYILIIITFSLLFLSSCSDNKKKNELYASLMDELKDVNAKIDESELYSTYYTFEIYEWTYINDAPYKYSFPDKDSYEKIDCVMNKDLSYLYQERNYYVQDEHKHSSNYYSVHNNDIYKVQKLDKPYSEEVEYEFNLIEDGTALDDIIGFTEFEKLRINGFDWKNGKINKKENTNSGSLAYDYTIEMKYSDVKDEELIKTILTKDNILEYKDYIKDDSKVTLYYKLETVDYNFHFNIEFVKEDTLYTAEIDFSRYENKDVDKNIEYKQKIDLIFNKEKEINLLPQKEVLLSFTPKYSGYYDININLSNPVNVTIGEEKYSGSNLKITILLNSNEKYPINIENQDKYSEGNINITYSNKVNMDNISIRGNDTYVLKLSKIDGLRNIRVNNDNISLDRFAPDTTDYYDTRMYNYLIIRCSINESTSSASCLFDEEKVFLLYLKNKTDEDIDNISVSVEDIKPIEMDSINEITVDQNYTFYRIDNKVAGQYKINILDGEINSYRLYDLNYNVNAYNSKNEISMEKDKSYYIGFKNNKKNTVKLEFQKEEVEYEWQITGDDGFLIRTYENTVTLKRGYNYHIDLFVNGEIYKDNSSFSDIDENDNYIYDANTRSLYIKDDAVINYNFNIRMKFDDDNYKLKVYTTFDETKIETKLNIDEKLELEVFLPNRILSFDYIVKIGDKEYKYNFDNEKNMQCETTVKIDLSDYIQNKEDIQIQIYNLTLAAYYEKINYPCDIIVKL